MGKHACVTMFGLESYKFYVLSYVTSLEAWKEDFDTPTRTAIGTFVFGIITVFSVCGTIFLSPALRKHW